MKSRTVQESAADLGDQTCIYCGASLAGLTASDRCPGCGRLAVDSLLGNNLRDAEAPWLRTLLRGLTLAMIGQLIFAAAALVYIGLAVAAMAEAHRSIMAELPRYYVYTTFIAWIPMVLGVWWICQREPSDALIARRRGAAWIARIAAIVALLTTARYLVPSHIGQGSPVRNAAEWTHDIVQVLGLILLWVVIARIIDRTPRHEVRRVLTAMMLFTFPAGIVMADSLPPQLAIGTETGAAPAGIVLGIGIIKLAYALAAAYTLLISGKAIRRTIGDWT